MEIKVCVGSSCHLKGANKVVKRLQELVEDLEERVEISLIGSFCQEKCTEGVVIHINNKRITKINSENIGEVLLTYINGGDLRAGVN